MYSILFHLPPVGLNMNATSIGIDIHEGVPNTRLTHLPIEHAISASYHTTHTHGSHRWQVGPCD